MSRSFLPSNFAMQSGGCERVSVAAGRVSVGAVAPIDDGRGLAIALVGRPLPHSRAVVRIVGLLPGRFYRVEGAADPFRRTDAAGVMTLDVAVGELAMLALWPVV